MLAKTKRVARSLAVTMAATAAVTISMPASQASAMSRVECIGGVGFLKVYSHSTWYSSVDCYANAGRVPLNTWVDRIYTGDNVVIYYDANGDSVRLERWTDTSFPNRPPRVKDIQIL